MMEEETASKADLESEGTRSNIVVTNGLPAKLFTSSQANTVPLIGPLTLTNCDSSVGSPTSSTPSPSASADKTDNPGSFSFHSDKPDMRLEEERLKTFDKWPVSFLPPKALASNGFYYLGRGDEVRCAFCKVEIMRWVEGDDPATDHKKWAPQCPFLRKQVAPTSIPADRSVNSRDECGARATMREPVKMPGPVHMRYATEVARLASFKDWPRCMKQKPKELAEAGFFYTGQGDKTKCFYCDGGLKDWENDDVPWEQHARWFDRCAFVLLIKGRDYVQRVITEACAIGSTEEKTDMVPPDMIPPAMIPPATIPPAAVLPATIPAPPAPVARNDEQERDEKSIDDKNICRICFAEERNVCFVPCGHVVCAKCALSTDKCPMCRQTFTTALRLYF